MKNLLEKLRKMPSWLCLLFAIIGLSLMPLANLIVYPLKYLNYIFIFAIALAIIMSYSVKQLIFYVFYGGNHSVNKWIIIYLQIMILFGLIYFAGAHAYGFGNVLFGIGELEWNKNIYTIRSYFEALATFVYFSFLTITTLGYSDIYPLGTWAKVSVVLEVAVGLYIVVIAITRAIDRREVSSSNRRLFFTSSSRYYGQRGRNRRSIAPPSIDH